MVVIEVKGSEGTSPRLERLNQHVIRIGRAPDNDVITDDPYIDAHHISLDVSDAASWHVSDLDSVNGTLKSHHSISSTTICSGDELTIGRTRLRIFDLEHRMQPALSLRTLEHLLFGFNSTGSLVLFVAAIALYPCIAIYLNSSGAEIKPDTYLVAALSSIGTSLVLAAAWSLLGRLLRSESRFRVLLNLTIVFWLVSSLLSLLVYITYYNFPGGMGRGFANVIFMAVLLGIYVYLGLLISTRLAVRSRQIISLTVMVGLLGTFAVTDFSRRDQYRPNPSYDGLVRSPRLLFRSGESQVGYRARLPDVFAQADELALDTDAED
jgi:pSer/pThr/pTyr-binding forkhead associated (FHA) protein